MGKGNAAWPLLGSGGSFGSGGAACLCGGSWPAYGGLPGCSLKSASFPDSCPVSFGDRILLCLSDTPAFVRAPGAMPVGARPVPVGTSLKTQDPRFLPEDSGPRLPLTLPGRLPLEAAAQSIPAVLRAQPPRTATGTVRRFVPRQG